MVTAVVSCIVIFDAVKQFQNNICSYFFMFKEGLEQKGQPPSPTKSKAEQPEDLHDDAEGRWPDSFSELVINFAFGGKGLLSILGKELENLH